MACQKTLVTQSSFSRNILRRIRLESFCSKTEKRLVATMPCCAMQTPIILPRHHSHFECVVPMMCPNILASWANLTRFLLRFAAEKMHFGRPSSNLASGDCFPSKAMQIWNLQSLQQTFWCNKRFFRRSTIPNIVLLLLAWLLCLIAGHKTLRGSDGKFGHFLRWLHGQNYAEFHVWGYVFWCL